MRFVLLVLAMSFLFVAGNHALAAHAPALPPGFDVPRGWLADYDSGRFDRCWIRSASAMRHAISQSHWREQNQKQAEAFGKLEDRWIDNVQSQKQAIAADGSKISGEFTELDFICIFARKNNVKEHVTVMKDTDGVWRIFAYAAHAGPNLFCHITP